MATGLLASLYLFDVKCKELTFLDFKLLIVNLLDLKSVDVELNEPLVLLNEDGTGEFLNKVRLELEFDFMSFRFRLSIS